MQNEQPVSTIRNIGETSAGWIAEAGLSTVADVAAVGPLAAFQIVRRNRPDVSLNLLWALAAGLEDRDWRDLSQNEKDALLAELEG